MEADEPQGAVLMRAAVELVIAELRRNPEGLRNVDVGHRTGLFLPVTNHPGYITWSILRYLTEQGKVAKHRQLYKLVG